MQNAKSYTVKEALQKTQRYCAYQERCHQEVERKLRQLGMVDEAILHIVGKLLEDNYLNEERFAKSFVRGKFRIKHWGRLRIIRELKIKDISKFNIEIALKELNDIDYANSLHNLAIKRVLQIKETNPYKRKKKLCDYLLYRGWESHLVYEKARELIDK